MTTQEFSIEFDILYNNLASNSAPPINEYEKSVLLTKAQSDIVLGLYSGRNQLGLSFESTEEARRYLNVLNTYDEQELKDSSSFYYSSNLMFRTNIEYEKTEDKITTITPVILVTHDDKARIINNPFKNGNSGRRILAIEEDNEIKFCSPAKVTGTIKIYGIRKPSPIILPNIDEEGLTIDDTEVTSEGKECELDSSLHYMILERAVLLAKQAYIGGQTQA